MDPIVSSSLNTTLGAFQIGVLVSYALFGVTTTQAYIYYSRFPDDPAKLKALVAFVWVCEFGHAICVGNTLYIYTISDYGHPESLALATPKSLGPAVFFSGVITASVQGFFSSRIYALSKKLYISILIWGMTFLRLLGCIVMLVGVLNMTSLVHYEAQWGWLLTATWSVSAANDWTITATLVVLLYKQRANVFKRTAALVDKIIAWTIDLPRNFCLLFSLTINVAETGMLTSASNIAMVACFVAMEANYIYLAIFVVGARLFSNSLLASLNSRTTLREMNQVTLPSLTPAMEPCTGNDVQTTKMTQIAYDAESSRGPSNDAASEV
ncbi:hypothetical protein B0H13DRAFT_2323637 [Mycena leptocephala]|nr:hypothetical protein B0H13DRAFT_2323637 [Mycena leptocephala]